MADYKACCEDWDLEWMGWEENVGCAGGEVADLFVVVVEEVV